MPGFSQYSQVVKPAEYVEPVSLDLLAKGTMYKEQMLEQNLEGISNLIYNTENMPSLQGIDTEKKNEIINNIKEQASQLSYSDLANPAVANQLKGYITSVTKDPDMQGIMQRGYSYETELKNKKDAEAKNKNYYSPIIDQANNYMNAGTYLKESRFNGEGFVDPELQKLKAEYLKNVPKVKTQKKVGGYWVETESYDQDALNANLSELYSRPDIQKYLNYTFAQKYADVNWDDKGREKVTDLLTKAQQTAALAKANLAKTPNDRKAIADLEEANGFVSNYQSLLSNPSLVGSQLRSSVINQDVQNMINEDIKSSNFMSQLSVNEDAFALKAQDLSNSLVVKGAEEQYKIAGELRQLHKESGLDPTNPIYQYDPNRYTTDAANIILKNKDVAEKNKPGSGKNVVTLGGIAYDKESLIKDVQSGKIETIKQLLPLLKESEPEYRYTGKEDPEVSGTDIRYNVTEKKPYDIWEDDASRKVTMAELINFINNAHTKQNPIQENTNSLVKGQSYQVNGKLYTYTGDPNNPWIGTQ